jgi:hypothetical protein
MMGGVVTCAYLLKNRDIAAKTVFLQFYATPGDGSPIANIASLVARLTHVNNAQVVNLETDIEKKYLGDQATEWQSAHFDIPSYCAYEEQPTYGVKIVSFESATALCNAASNPIDTNHIDIVKPASQQA